MKKSIAFLVGFFLLLPGCAPTATPYSKTGLFFDTVVTITVYSREALPAVDQCFSLAEHYESLFSDRIDTSDVSRINAAEGASVKVNPDTFTLLSIALSYAKLSDGAFDPTIGALSKLWDFTGENPTVPSQEAIDVALATVDYTGVQMDEASQTVCLTNPNAQLDLGDIAKGYIADRMKEYLLSEGINSALINLGGNVLAVGEKPDGSPYRVGIQKPFAEDGTPLATLSVKDSSVVSSGIYERYFEENSTLYHHILDTKTGYPLRNNLHAVTICSDASVDGDALSTICFCLGLDEGKKLIDSLPDTEAIFVTDDEVLHPTSDTLPLS